MGNENRIKAVGKVALVLAGLGLLAGFRLCYGDPPPMSISRSNDTVTVSWRQTTNAWQVFAKSGWDRDVYSNGVVIYREIFETELIRPATNVIFQTNGSNISVTMPIDHTGNQKWFFLEPTNNLPPPF